jgi:hypothetical protein
MRRTCAVLTGAMGLGSVWIVFLSLVGVKLVGVGRRVNEAHPAKPAGKLLRSQGVIT